ncbi:MAG: iron-sulfur cluster assembly scaffold protein [Alphaproteobacteria bacterium]|nr:iron-sulfur cluster assembly scaffold protein [Alphaproteobacteria bacterium]
MNSALYNEDIKALARARIGAGRLDSPTAQGFADNPFCGDRIELDIEVTDGRITALAHRTRGCLLCEAAASAMAQAALGATPAEALAIGENLDALMRGDEAPPSLARFAPVAAHRNRHECVTLPFRALTIAVRSAARDHLEP